MARTKAEVRAFLDSLVGRTCVDKSSSALNGQCVCLIKNLMEFLGVANPYAARGNAKDAGDAYISQGIGTNGRGWLTVVVNRDMAVIGGVRYGHIWVDLLNEANYESNGARALVTTKNTRPISQGQQFVNFDKWVKGDEDMAEKTNLDTARILAHMSLARDGYDGRPSAHAGAADGDLKKHHVGVPLTNKYIRDNFFSSPEASNAFKIKDNVYKERDNLRKQVKALTAQVEELKKTQGSSEDSRKLQSIKDALK